MSFGVTRVEKINFDYVPSLENFLKQMKEDGVTFEDIKNAWDRIEEKDDEKVN